MFNYIGSKCKLATAYPPPVHGVIVEPFAGSAGFSTRYGITRDVVLVDQTKDVIAAWDWLIHASRGDVLGLPLVPDIPYDGLRAMDLHPGAKAFVGFCIGRGMRPRYDEIPPWGYQDGGRSGYWNAARREKISDAVRHIRHWTTIHGNYTDAPDVEATWFVDPPYQQDRLRAMYLSKVSDYAELGRWCRARRGQVIACDVMGADWLPFQPVKHTRSYSLQGAGRTDTPVVVEAYWSKGDTR